MGRGDHRKLAGGHVAADGLHRNVLVAEDHAGKRLDLDILHRGALDFGEFANLILRKADIVHVALRDFGDQLVDLVLAQPVARRREIVELLGKRAHRGVAPCLDVGKRRLPQRRGPWRHPRNVRPAACRFSDIEWPLIPPDYFTSGRGAARSPRS